VYTKYSTELLRTLTMLDKTVFDLAVHKVVSVLNSDASIYIFGNGGSSANASHFAVDWRKGVSEKLGFYPRVFSLTDNVPMVTALANDVGYETIFSEQIKNFGKKDDLALAISGSGNSANVINGLKAATEIGMHTISLTGFDGGEAGRISSMNCHVDSWNIRIVEDIHASFGHSVVESIVMTA
jgi:D-sedoheptulose 7-phosphate isomerase